MNDIMIERYWEDNDNDRVYRIRFIKVGELWYAVLKDICDALGLDTWHVSQRITPTLLLKRTVSEETPLKRGYPISGQHRNGYVMTLVCEHGIFQAIGRSDKVEARKFEMWWIDTLVKIREAIGLETYQCFDMLKPEVQEHISKQLDKVLPEFDPYLDNIYFDEKTGKLMQSITVAGGDVEQVEYTGDDYHVVHY